MCFFCYCFFNGKLKWIKGQDGQTNRQTEAASNKHLHIHTHARTRMNIFHESCMRHGAIKTCMWMYTNVSHDAMHAEPLEASPKVTHCVHNRSLSSSNRLLHLGMFHNCLLSTASTAEIESIAALLEWFSAILGTRLTSTVVIESIAVHPWNASRPSFSTLAFTVVIDSAAAHWWIYLETWQEHPRGSGPIALMRLPKSATKGPRCGTSIVHLV